MAERSSGARQSDEAILGELDAAPAAFAVFFRRHAGELLGDLEYRTHNRTLAGDVCAETFAASLAGAHRFDPSRGSAAAWLNEIAERELAHAERTGAAGNRARRRLGLAPLEAAGEGFVADLEDELVAAARFRAERRSRRPVLPRPSSAALRAVIAGAAALALVAAVAVALQDGEADIVAGERSAAALPRSVSFRLLPMQPLAPCPEAARRPHAVRPAIGLLSRPQGSADSLPFPARMLPIGTFDARSTRRATHTRLWSTVHVVPSLEVAADGECGSHAGPGLCVVADAREFRCFTDVDVEWGRAVARTAAATLVGIVPDGVERVAIHGVGPPVGADVVDNVYEAQLDMPAGLPVRLELDRPAGDHCRRTVAPELLSEVALLSDAAQQGDTLPQAAREALGHWQLDAVVEDGARFWGRSDTVAFWAVPVVPRGRAPCAPATRVCGVAVDERARAAAQCVLGRNRHSQHWWLGHLPPGTALIFGTVPDGVTSVRVKSNGATIDVEARGNVFGALLPFRYPLSDPPRIAQLRR